MATKTKSDGLLQAAGWIHERNAGERVSVICWEWNTDIPQVILSSVKDLKELFPGVSVEVKKTCTSTDYKAVVDGICFTASTYGCGEAPTNWTEVL